MLDLSSNVFKSIELRISSDEVPLSVMLHQYRMVLSFGTAFTVTVLDVRPDIENVTSICVGSPVDADITIVYDGIPDMVQFPSTGTPYIIYSVSGNRF